MIEAVISDENLEVVDDDDVKLESGGGGRNIEFAAMRTVWMLRRVS